MAAFKTEIYTYKNFEETINLQKGVVVLSYKNVVKIFIILVYKVVISVCMSDHNSGTPWPICLNFDWGTRENHRNVLSLVLRF